MKNNDKIKLADIHPFDATKAMVCVHLLQSASWLNHMITQINERTEQNGWRANRNFMMRTEKVFKQIDNYNNFINLSYEDNDVFHIAANVSEQICVLVNLSSEDRAKVYELIDELQGKQSKFTTDHTELIKEYLEKLNEAGVKYSRIEKQECIGAIVFGGWFPTVEDALNAHNILAKMNVDYQYPVNLMSEITK